MSRKGGLGRGLGSLLPIGERGEESSIYRELPLAAISPNSNQPRKAFDDESLNALSASIAAIGVLQPILVRAVSEDSYEIIAGERRFRAAKRAGLDRIPALVHNADELSSLERAVVENLHRQDLNPLGKFDQETPAVPWRVLQRSGLGRSCSIYLAATAVFSKSSLSKHVTCPFAKPMFRGSSQNPR